MPGVVRRDDVVFGEPKRDLGIRWLRLRLVDPGGAYHSWVLRDLRKLCLVVRMVETLGTHQVVVSGAC